MADTKISALTAATASTAAVLAGVQSSANVKVTLSADALDIIGKTNAQIRTQLALVIGTNVQAWDTDLDTWAAITRASGFDTFVATPSSANLRALLTDEVGTGAAYFVGGALGTPASGTATNLTGLPVSTGISGLGTGIATALAVNTGSAGAPVLFNGAGGTPSSLTLTNATGLPIAGGGTGAITAQAAQANLKGVYILGASAATGMSVTGTVTKTTLATITVPANAMGANGILRITTLWSYTNSANNKVLKITFGGSDYMSRTDTTTSNERYQVQIANRNATNSQVGVQGGVSTGGWSTGAGSTATSSADTTASQDITISGTLANTGETITLESYLVELIVP